ncbi:MAG: B12-binding domain-containing radical SAM protein [Proteobacteria bacterium]|nr:B12-binding domain-containing radical SAM protein [Pseudomonadota bacterium]MBU1640402.1 B12-binding domain-containing radical SAM protein [Pseudomonadota bacterium]
MLSKSKKKILFISPARNRGPDEDFVFKLSFLNLPYLAAVTPSDYEVEIIDEEKQVINFDDRPWLVALTAQTPIAPRAYEVADEFKKRGIPTVMGGVHASTLPDEALAHVDSVIIGEGEFVWQELLADLEKGELKERYTSGTSHSLAGLPWPRRDLLNPRHYIPLTLVETTRGCPHHCDFCGVSKFFGHRYRKRPLAEITAELESLFGGGFRHGFSRFMAKLGLDMPYFIERRLIYFIDSNFAADRKYALEIMEVLERLDVKWWCHATVDIAQDQEFLKRMNASGCLAVNVGFESLSAENLKTMHKSYAARHDYVAAIKAFHDNNIGVMGTFVVGFDDEESSIFRRIFDFSIDNQLDWSLTFIRTPYPGTSLYEQMEKEDRIAVRDWQKYDTLHCVFKPGKMSVVELEDGLKCLWRYTFSLSSIYRRIIKGPRVHPLFYLGMNMQFFQMVRKWHTSYNPFIEPDKR